MSRFICQCKNQILYFYSIGFSIAKRLAQEGAKVLISSRKELNVKNAVEKLKCEGLEVAGTVCHVGNSEDRRKLFEKVSCNKFLILIFLFHKNLNLFFCILFSNTNLY